MVGSPGQTTANLAEDMLFLKKLNPQMVGIGPFIPHHDTLFAMNLPERLELTLFMLALIRLMLPKVLLPSTTALGTISSKRTGTGNSGRRKRSHAEPFTGRSPKGLLAV